MLVFAAASLTDALTDLGAEYEAETGERVVFSFGESQHLARQIADGAPADMLIPAGRQPIELLERAAEDRRGAHRPAREPAGRGR